MAPIVLRITRHPLDDEREAFLRQVFGDGLQVITDDVPYGDDPIAAVKALIERYQTGDNRVVALEAQAPFPVLMRLVDRRGDFGGGGVAVIRAQFKRDADGRNLVVGKEANGRDKFAFSHYEELMRIVFETRPLSPS